MKTISHLVIALFLAALAGLAGAAAGTSPDALVKSTVEEVLAVIKQNPDKRTLRKVAQEKVVQHFDFQAMTRLAVGRAWKDATPEQQKRLEEQFRSLLVNTYTAALSRTAGKNRTLDVKPVQAGTNDKDVTVHTIVKDEKPLAIDYKMEQTSNGWKVYDVIVEGVSLVTTYRGSFNDEVAKGGVDGLIRSLETKNRQLAQA